MTAEQAIRGNREDSFVQMEIAEKDWTPHESTGGRMTTCNECGKSERDCRCPYGPRT